MRTFLCRPNAPFDHSSILAFINRQQITSVLFGCLHPRSWDNLFLFLVLSFFWKLHSDLAGCFPKTSTRLVFKQCWEYGQRMFTETNARKQIPVMKSNGHQSAENNPIKHNCLLGLFDEYDAKRSCKCNNNQGGYFRYGAHDPQSRSPFIFSVLFPLQTACQNY